ncbi:MAG: hypothetical protein RL338_1455 [Chloroflexota bacterium]|jgi:hypothetical protein
MGGTGSPTRISARGVAAAPSPSAVASQPAMRSPTPIVARVVAAAAARRSVIRVRVAGPPTYWTVSVPTMFGWTVQTNAYAPAGSAGIS